MEQGPPPPPLDGHADGGDDGGGRPDRQPCHDPSTGAAVVPQRPEPLALALLLGLLLGLLRGGPALLGALARGALLALLARCGAGAIDGGGDVGFGAPGGRVDAGRAGRGVVPKRRPAHGDGAVAPTVAQRGHRSVGSVQRGEQVDVRDGRPRAVLHDHSVGSLRVIGPLPRRTCRHHHYHVEERGGCKEGAGSPPRRESLFKLESVQRGTLR
mmetsp:Transcript_21199/g.55279  ORF Transcript_21199/g.55279 Transcript_21199/m.55279 type:complete len:213 (+) Transcript_21199:199-837(+)